MSVLAGNVAQDHGGAISLEAGVLVLASSQIQQNFAKGSITGEYLGLGGGLYAAERCLGSTCTSLSATLSGCSVAANYAKQVCTMEPVQSLPTVGPHCKSTLPHYLVEAALEPKRHGPEISCRF